MGIALFKAIQRAIQTPFNNALNGFTAVECQSAIEEARDTAPGLASRYVAQCGKEANSQSGVWLQFFRGNPSNTSPFIFNEDSEIKGLSVSVRNNTTCDFDLYINGALIYTLSLSSSKVAKVKGLSLLVNEDDEMSIQLTGGGARDITMNIFITVSV